MTERYTWYPLMVLFVPLTAPDQDRVRVFPGATSVPLVTETAVGTLGAPTVVVKVAYAEERPELLLAPTVLIL